MKIKNYIYTFPRPPPPPRCHHVFSVRTHTYIYTTRLDVHTEGLIIIALECTYLNAGDVFHNNNMPLARSGRRASPERHSTEAFSGAAALEKHVTVF